MKTYEEHFAGEKAFIDAFVSGMVPCKVLQVTEDAYGDRVGSRNAVKVQVTEKHNGYSEGEVIWQCGVYIVPPAVRFYRDCHIMIRTNYVWKVSSKE